MSENSTVEGEAAVKNGTLRLVFVGIAIALELALVLFVVLRFNQHAEWIAILTRLLAAVIVLVICALDKTSSIKMTWVIFIMMMPVFGVTLYLFVGLNGSTREMRERYEAVDAELLPTLPADGETLARLDAADPRVGNIARYLKKTSSYPVYEHTAIEYYAEAVDGLEAQKRELRKAEKFIFMEYHAIEDAESWHGIQEILEDRVHAGVEVRVFYDDMGSIGFINTDFVDRLEAKGIHCKVFNPMSPGLNLFLNNRDHRKITVVDGLVGFTGGYNLANEYFNITHPFGYWKDTGVRLEGDAVQSLTVTFLEMWNAASEGDAMERDFARFLPKPEPAKDAQGFILPYADNPMDTEQVGEDVYISVADYAKNYAWYVTPYLIITDEMTHALGLAAKRGVDVRIITPGIPDKKMIYAVTRSYYHNLVKNGVRIFEYTPGFCHCKMSVADDVLATCGTINLDYRSLYHHFENGCLYCDCDAVADTKRDFEDMFAQSKEVTEDYKNPRSHIRIWHLILRLAAPLM